MPFTLRNIKEDLEDIGPRFDGAPDLEFRAATKPLALENCYEAWLASPFVFPPRRAGRSASATSAVASGRPP